MLALGRLHYRALTPHRRAVLESLVGLSLDPVEASRVLKLGPKGAAEVDRNRRLRRAPVLPAIERYSGVLYEGIGVGTLDATARGWLDEHVRIASALFGLVAAGDPIPAYRLSASTALPGVPLTRHWAEPVSAVLRRERDWLLDARSGGYTALGPAPAGTAVLHVETAEGRALGHFNKLPKGRLVRALAETQPAIGSRDDLLRWAADRRVPLRARGDRDVVLTGE